MREMRRKPEVPEKEVQVEECLDGPARITSKEFAPIHSVKSGTLQNAFFYKTKSGCKFGEKVLIPSRQKSITVLTRYRPIVLELI